MEREKKEKENQFLLHQASAFKRSGSDSEIRRLNSLKTFDDQLLLAVIT